MNVAFGSWISPKQMNLPKVASNADKTNTEADSQPLYAADGECSGQTLLCAESRLIYCVWVDQFTVCLALIVGFVGLVEFLAELTFISAWTK